MGLHKKYGIRMKITEEHLTQNMGHMHWLW